MTEQTLVSPEGQPVPHSRQPFFDPSEDATRVLGTTAHPEDQGGRLRRMYEQFADQPVPERLLALFDGKV
jgi:hypothetical protein